MLARRKPVVLTGMRRAQPAGALVAAARTLDQARGVVTFLDAASERTLRSTVALTAARGRGKSAVRPPARSQNQAAFQQPRAIDDRLLAARCARLRAVSACVRASPRRQEPVIDGLLVAERQPGVQKRQSSFRHCCQGGREPTREAQYTKEEVPSLPDAAELRLSRAPVSGRACCGASARFARQALGLAVAGALALGYSNIFVTAPSPENLRTLFEFVAKARPGSPALLARHDQAKARWAAHPARRRPEACMLRPGMMGAGPGLRGGAARAS